MGEGAGLALQGAVDGGSGAGAYSGGGGGYDDVHVDGGDGEPQKLLKLRRSNRVGMPGLSSV